MNFPYFLRKLFSKKMSTAAFQTRRFKAADSDRLVSTWQADIVNINQEIYRSLRSLRARSRDLSQNNDYVKQYLRLCKNHIVGPDGPILQLRAKNLDGSPDTFANEIIESEFKKWGRRGSCDVTGKLSWIESLDLIIETVARDGEALLRKIRGANNKYAFVIQHLDPNLLDIFYNDPARNIAMGIEIDDWGKPVAYHLLKDDERYPFYTSSSYSAGKHERVLASDIIHVFVTEYPGQLRGFPWLHTCMRRLHNVEGMEESELVASRVSAAKMGFFERNEMGEGYEGQMEKGELITDAEPGTFEQLPYGVKLATFDPQHPNSQFPGFIKSNLRGAAAGLGVSYNSLASDLEGVNFSSIRQGVLEDRDNWMKKQKWLFATVCDDIYQDWLQMSMLTGIVPMPVEKFKDVTWQGRRWQWVDPFKDISAAKIAIDERLKSRGEVIREQGRDPEDVWMEVEQEAQMPILKTFSDSLDSKQIVEDDAEDV